MDKQIKVNENELHDIIAEAVAMTINEAGGFSRWWNGIRGRRRPANAPQPSRTPSPSYRQYVPVGDSTPYAVGNVPDFSNIGRREQHMAPSSSQAPQAAPQPVHPNVVQQPQNAAPQPVHPNIGHPQNSGPQPTHPSIGQPPHNSAPQAAQPSQPQQRPQQPQQPRQQQQQYKRGRKYHVNFSQENEHMFNRSIVPTYNSITNVMKSLNSLKEIGQENYNQASSVFNIWGRSNIGGGQKAYANVCKQIDSIMPTLEALKSEMKAVLYANGVRDSEDYQHYHMQEQRLRKIISGTISRVLKESLR